ncbi:MAG: DUF2812 domain-containing protein [Oscillospiraceae bacterium]|nr:DUF2812 domain-containing protein [Oscillospiraceae bacterium]
MRKTKHCIAQFTFYDRTGIQAFLEGEAEKGWLLDKIGSFGWRFRRIEPKKVHFAVTYFPDASAFDPGPSEKEHTFREFCAHSGWMLAASNAQLQIFYNEQEDPVPIETDPLIELDNIHKSAKKGYLLSYWLLLAVSVMQVCMQVWRIGEDFVDSLSQNTTLFLIPLYGILWLMCTVEIAGYYRWRRKAIRAAEADGVFVPTKGNRGFMLAMLWIITVAFLAMLCSMGDSKFMVIGLSSVLIVFIVISMMMGAMALMKKLGVSRAGNALITITLSVALSFGLSVAVLWSVISAVDAGWLEREPVATHEFQGRTYELYADDIPLTLEDLGRAEDARYSYEMTSQESMLLAQHQCDQIARWGENKIDWFRYSVVEVKAGFLYEPTLNSLLDTGDHGYSTDIFGNVHYDGYRQVDAAPWGAAQAYQIYFLDEPLSSYVLCYDGLILVLNPDWNMTPEEMAIVGAIFG